MYDDTEEKALAVGAATALVAVTGYLTLAGYSVARSLRSDPAGLLFYGVLVASLGAALAAAWRRNLRVAVAGAVLALAVVPLSPLLATPPFERPLAPAVSKLLLDLLVVWVAFALAATVEYAARRPAIARDALTPAAMRAGVAAGVVHLAVVAAARTWLGTLNWSVATPFTAAAQAWTLLGAFLVGAVAGVLFQRYRLVTPALVVAGTLSTAGYLTYARTTGNTLAPSWLTFYAALWFVVAALALSAGLVEHRTRTRNADRPSSSDA